MAVCIRTATMADYDAICRLIHALDEFHIALRPQMLQSYEGRSRTREHVGRYMDSSQRAMFLAELEGVAVGLAAVEALSMPEHPMFRHPNIGMLMELVVEPRVRQQGIGRRLVEAVREWTTAHDLPCLQVNVQSTNEAALRFYQSMGFEPFLQRLWMIQK